MYEQQEQNNKNKMGKKVIIPDKLQKQLMSGYANVA